jgi:group I intron endonuclease
VIERDYSVYCHIFPNGKRYVGITSLEPSKRWGNGGSNYGHQPLIKAAINKYGWDNISHEILEKGLTKKEAEDKEVYYISLYKSNERSFGYNIENGGNAQGKVSEESKEKNRKSNLGHPSTITPEGVAKAKATKLKNKDKYIPYWLGKKKSPESIQKQREHRTGIKHTPETKAKMSESRRGEKNHMYGKRGPLSPLYRRAISEEHKEAIRKSKLGKPRPEYVVEKMRLSKIGTQAGAKNPNAKKVVNLKSGKVYDCYIDATKDTGDSYYKIYNHCNGKIKKVPQEWKYYAESN